MEIKLKRQLTCSYCYEKSTEFDIINVDNEKYYLACYYCSTMKKKLIDS